MSTTERPQPQPLSNRPLEEEDDNLAVEKIQGWYENNKKQLSTAGTVIIVIAAAIFAYFKLYQAPRETKAADKAYFAQQYFAADSLEKALQGDGQHWGFVKVIKEYGSTKTGNLAHFYAGICYLKTGDPKKAIKMLEDFDGKGTMVAATAYGRLGDAYMETGDTKKAIDNYEKATTNKDDVLQTPLFLLNLGIAYQTEKKTEEAKKAFLRIRDEFPASMQARDVDRYLARLGDLN